MKWFLNGFKNYAKFSGRASRTEFWIFYLLYFIATCIVLGVDLGLGIYFQLGLPYLTMIYLLGTTLPSLAISVLVRRLHDSGKSGAWYFICFAPFRNIILIVLYCLESQPIDNQYVPKPGTKYSVA